VIGSSIGMLRNKWEPSTLGQQFVPRRNPISGELIQSHAATRPASARAEHSGLTIPAATAAARCRLTWDDHGMTLEKARKAEAEQARKDRKRADENKHGGIHVDDDRRVERATENSSTALRRRLARHAPGLLAAWEQGEFRSVRAAAIAAGLIRPLNGLGDG
jgi:hypothetical protein